MREVAARLARGARKIGGRLRRLPPLAILAIALVLAVTATEVWIAVKPAATPLAEPIITAGLPSGATVSAYGSASRAKLSQLSGTTPIYALVSLKSYLAPDPVASVTLGVQPVFAYLRMLPMDPAGEPVRLPVSHLPEDLVAGLAALIQPADCVCTYALVLRGTPARLRDVAARPGVRIVDPLPSVTDPGRTVFVAPLPDSPARGG